MAQKIIVMTEKELIRGDIIKSLIDSKINGTDASKQIGVTIRHVRRLKATVAHSGTAGLAHGNRGKESGRKISVFSIR